MSTDPNPADITLVYRSREDVTNAIIISRKEKSISWTSISQAMQIAVALSTAVCLGQMSTDREKASALVFLLSLDDSAIEWLIEPSDGGTSLDLLLQDPFLHRLCEIVSIHGPALKALASEEFGDGVISTTNFALTLNRLAHPQGDRVEVSFDGKFIPYRMS